MGNADPMAPAFGVTAGASGRRTARVKGGQPRQFRDLGLMTCERVTSPPDVNFEKDLGVVWPAVSDGIKDQPMLHGCDFEAARQEGIQLPEPLDGIPAAVYHPPDAGQVGAIVAGEMEQAIRLEVCGDIQGARLSFGGLQSTGECIQALAAEAGHALAQQHRLQELPHAVDLDHVVYIDLGDPHSCILLEDEKPFSAQLPKRLPDGYTAGTKPPSECLL
jgi:hypothetical protein